MKDLVIIMTSQELYYFLQADWAEEDIALANAKLPELNFPLAAYFDHNNMRIELRNITDEKFNLYVSDQEEFLKLMEHFNDYKPQADLEAAQYLYPIAIHFDAATKTYTVEQDCN